MGRSEREGSRQPQLSLLGSFQLLLGDEMTRLPMPSQRMVAFLGLQNGRPVGRSYVAGTLWPEVEEASARSDLRSALWKLGQLRDDLVEVTNDDLRLRPDICIDLREMRVRAQRVLDDSRDAADLSPELFADDLLPQWSDAWVETERESYRQLRLHALEQLSERLAVAGRFGPAVEAGLLAVAGAPLRESAHRAVIRVLAMEGNRAEARQRYGELSSLLRDEMGVEPSFRLEAIMKGI
jgi:DNA-binding SARP family transcriptional activator